MPKFVQLLCTIALLLCSWQPLSNAAEQESQGRVRIYSKSDAGGESTHDETTMLWSDGTIGAEERVETLVVFHGRTDFYGRAKDLVVLGGDVTLHPGSQISERLVVLGGNLHKKDGAKISEQVLFELPQTFPRWLATFGPFVSIFASGGAQFFGIVVRAVLVCLFGALAYVIAPELMRQAEARAVQMPLQSVLWSMLAAIGFLPGAVALVISIVGIVLIPLYIMSFAFVFIFLAYVMAANILGHYLPPRNSHVMPPLRFFYGVFILVLLSHVPLLGSMLIYLAMVVTGGAMFATLMQRFRGRQPQTIRNI